MRLIEAKAYSLPGFDIRELFTFDRFALSMLLLYVFIRYGFKNKLKNIDLYFLLFLCAVGLSIVQSNNVFHAIKVWFDSFVLCYFAYYIGKNYVSQDNIILNKYHSSVLVLGCVLIAISLTEFYMYGDIFMYRITGPFLYWENLGLALAIVFFIVWLKKQEYLSKTKIHRPMTKTFYNALTVLLSIVIFLTYTRTIMFVVLSGLFFISWKGKGILSTGTIKLYKGIVVFFIILTILSPVLLQHTNFYQHRLTKRTDEGRIENYYAALRMFASSPVFGIGLKNFEYEQVKYATKEEIEEWKITSKGTCHNSYLVIAAEIGILGLIPMMFLVYFSFRICSQYFKLAKDRPDKIHALAIWTITLVYFLSAMTFDPMFEPTIDNKLFFMCLGTAVGKYQQLSCNL